MDARTNRIGPVEAAKMARLANHVWIAKGKKTVHYNMKTDAPTDDDLAGQIIGPSGNLRAPTIRRGKILIVGFNEGMFIEQLT